MVRRLGHLTQHAQLHAVPPWRSRTTAHDHSPAPTLTTQSLVLVTGILRAQRTCRYQNGSSVVAGEGTHVGDTGRRRGRGRAGDEDARWRPPGRGAWMLSSPPSPTRQRRRVRRPQERDAGAAVSGVPSSHSPSRTDMARDQSAPSGAPRAPMSRKGRCTQRPAAVAMANSAPRPRGPPGSWLARGDPGGLTTAQPPPGHDHPERHRREPGQGEVPGPASATRRRRWPGRSGAGSGERPPSAMSAKAITWSVIEQRQPTEEQRTRAPAGAPRATV